MAEVQKAARRTHRAKGGRRNYIHFLGRFLQTLSVHIIHYLIRRQDNGFAGCNAIVDLLICLHKSFYPQKHRLHRIHTAAVYQEDLLLLKEQQKLFEMPMHLVYYIKNTDAKGLMINRPYITIVSGLPRSGTSMMMRVIHAGGIEPLTDHIRKPDEDNPKGYYEFEPVKKTKQDASWLKDAPGKAVKMVYRLLYDLPDAYEYRVVFMQRDLTEVLASQKKMLERSGKTSGGVSDQTMAVLFAAELDKCQKWLASQPHFRVLYISHRQMIDNPLPQCQTINAFLDGGLDVNAMAAAVDPSLYRNRNSPGR